VSVTAGKRAAVLEAPQETPTPPGITPRALLLDFGSVISLSLFERHRQTERALNLPEGSLTWLGPLDPETDALWVRMQRDEITERDYWAIRARELGAAVGEPDWDMATMSQRLLRGDPNELVRPEMKRLIGRARQQGIRVGVLSNEVELFYGVDIVRRFTVLDEMDVIVDATHTKILKPDPGSYALALGGLKLPARDVLFVDDQFRNIAGAVAAGMQTQYFDIRDVQGNIAAIAARLNLDPKGDA
jgi:putative hydrolase of the HAD superfamily